MQIKILRSTVIKGQDVKAGEILDTPPQEAQLLFMLGKAEPAPAKPAKAKAKAKAQ